MGFNETKDKSGVAVVQVEGQLIVGNRQELKELVQAALSDNKQTRKLLTELEHTAKDDF